MILLGGVLALSWRLNTDPATRPSVSQNTLTPGMGFVDDDSDSEAEGNVLNSQADEEANLANRKESPSRDQRNSPRIPSAHDPRTPTTKSNDLLGITRQRRKAITESEEILEELEDDALAELSPFSRQRSSARSTPASKVPSRGNSVNDYSNESTALLARSSTVRSYRDRRRRRSTSILGTQERERRRRSASSQEALGGWWKMKKWWRGKEKKDKGNSIRNGNGNGSGNGTGDST